MSTAYICEGVRTPIGRYAGALAPVRTDDLAAVPLAALRRQFAEQRLGEHRRRFLWLHQSSRRRQSQRCPHGLAAGRFTRKCSGCDRESPVRFRDGGGRGGGASHCRRRDRAGNRGRRRKHEPRSAGDSQGGIRIFAPRGNPRFHAGLAIRQSADAGEIRSSVDAGDRGKRRGSLQDRPLRAGSICLSLTAESRGSPSGGNFRRRDYPGRRPGTGWHRENGQHRRAPASPIQRWKRWPSCPRPFARAGPSPRETPPE